MNMHWKIRQAGWKRQKGMTLMELLVAGSISVIVSSGMVILMASTLGTGTETIKMTKLSSEMRAAMQIMTRELRRANYHASYVSCFGNMNCLVDEGIDEYVTEININGDPTGDCFWFFYDRPQRGGTQELITDDNIAAFRLTPTNIGGVNIGTIQMAINVSTANPPDTNTCPTTAVVEDNEWVNITNPALVDIQSFSVSDRVPGFLSYPITINGTQSIERIGLTMSGKLRSDVSLPTWMQGNIAPLLTIQDFILVRNGVFRP